MVLIMAFVIWLLKLNLAGSVTTPRLLMVKVAKN